MILRGAPLAKTLGLDGAAVLFVCVLPGLHRNGQLLANSLKNTEFLLLFWAGSFVLYAALAGMLFAWRWTPGASLAEKQTRLLLILVGLLLFFTVTYFADPHGNIIEFLVDLIRNLWRIPPSEARDIALEFLLFSVPVMPSAILIGLVISSLRRLGTARAKGSRTITATILLGFAFYFAANAYEGYLVDLNWPEIHCGGHVPCK